MRKKLIIEPDGWPCRFADCRPGLFTDVGALCLKTDYGDDYIEDGDAYWGGVSGKAARDELMVQPVKTAWVNEEE